MSNVRRLERLQKKRAEKQLRRSADQGRPVPTPEDLAACVADLRQKLERLEPKHPGPLVVLCRIGEERAEQLEAAHGPLFEGWASAHGHRIATPRARTLDDHAFYWALGCELVDVTSYYRAVWTSAPRAKDFATTIELAEDVIRRAVAVPSELFEEQWKAYGTGEPARDVPAVVVRRLLGLPAPEAS